MSTVAFKARLAIGTTGTGNGPDGTNFYVEVTIASTQVGTTLTDFPVYVDLSDLPAAFFSNVQTDGGDIRVTENDGTTRCAVDLVTIDTGASTGELHFLASSISSSSDTTFRIYYNAASTLSQPAVGTTYGRNAVWSNYDHVVHLENVPASLIDSTGNVTPTTNGSMTSADSVTGKIGNGLDFDGADDEVVLSDTDPTVLTLTAWLNPDTLGSRRHQIFCKYADTGGEDSVLFSIGPSQDVYFGVFISSSVNDVVSTGTISNGSWQHIAATYDGTNVKVFINGSLDNSASASGSIDASSSKWRLGQRGTALDDFEYDGVMDEARIRPSAVSDDWIASEYTNQNTPTTFYTIGSPQAA